MNRGPAAPGSRLLSRPVAVRNLGWMGTARVLQSLLALGANFYLARVLGPEGFGVLGLAAALVSCFAILATLGVPVLATRETARAWDRRQQVAGDMAASLLVLGVVAYGCLVALLLVAHLSPLETAVSAISGLQLVAGPRTFLWAFSAAERMLVPALANLAGTLLRVGLVFGLVHAHGAVRLVAWTAVAGGAATAAGELAVYAGIYGLNWRFGPGTLWRIVRASAPLAISSMMTRVYTSLDTVILGYLSNAAAVGEFTAARKMFWLLIGFLDIYAQVLLPTVVRMRTTSPGGLSGLSGKGINLLIAILLPMAVGGTCLAQPLMQALFGPAYRPAGPVFVAMIWAAAASGVGVHFGTIVTALDGESSLAWATGWGALLDVAGNIWLVPRFGAPAAAWVTAAAEALVAVCAVWKVGRQFPIGPGLVLTPVMLSTVGMAAGLWMLRGQVSVWESLAAGIVIYGGLWMLWPQNRRMMPVLPGRKWGWGPAHRARRERL